MYKSSIFDSNPLSGSYVLGNYIGSCGPENCWKLFSVMRKSDYRDYSCFIFEKKVAEKLHKPRRKETITEILRSSVRQLERLRHPRILQIISNIEESNDTLAYITEPVLGSLANLLANHYNFIEIELKYGFLQV